MKSLRDTTINDFIAQMKVASPLPGIAIILLFNFALLFIRPEDEESYSIVGWGFHQIHFSFLLSLIPIPFWVARLGSKWTIQTKALLGLVFFGLLQIPFAVNNFWAAVLARDLFLLCVCLVFPMVVFLSYQVRIRQLVTIYLFVGFFLGVFALTHHGRGPGGFLGDENDLCFALTMFFPLPLFLFPLARSFPSKFSLLSIAGVVLAGVISTFSRGGFVGIVMSLIYIFWKTKTKRLMSFAGILLICGVWFLAPEPYWDKIKTIKNPSLGTAKARQEMWDVALKIFLDPTHILTGVGMGNAPYVLGKYEPSKNKTPSGTSIAGRAVHSLYLQILSELGLLGTSLFLIIVVASIRQNEKRSKEIDLLLFKLSTLLKAGRNETDVAEQSYPDNPEGDTRQKNIYFVAKELKFIQALSLSLNASWLAMLSSGAFVSVLYYPPLWVLTGTVVTIEVYWRRIIPSAATI